VSYEQSRRLLEETGAAVRLIDSAGGGIDFSGLDTVMVRTQSINSRKCLPFLYSCSYGFFICWFCNSMLLIKSWLSSSSIGIGIMHHFSVIDTNLVLSKVYSIVYVHCTLVCLSSY
jgi:hypothetical protein